MMPLKLSAPAYSLAHRRRLHVVATALITATLTLSACAGSASNGNSHSAPLSSVAPSETTPPTSSQTIEETTKPQPTSTEQKSDGLPEGFLGTPDTAEIDFDGTSGGELIPTTMRAGSHQGYDRVVIEFAGAGIPRWWAHYTESTSAPGSGFPVPYSGNIALEIGLEHTPWPVSQELRDAMLKPHAQTPGAGVVRSVEFVSAFEAQSHFVIGLDKKVPYSITYLDGPPRIVIDFLTNS